MSDSEYLEGMASELSSVIATIGRTNENLTRLYDVLSDPDETDTFDASCNTCRSFERKPMTPEEKTHRNIYGMPGRCAKKDVQVRG